MVISSPAFQTIFVPIAPLAIPSPFPTALDPAAVWGALTVLWMLLQLAARGPNATLVFAISWTLGASLLFIEGMWPLAAIQATFAIGAYCRWWIKRVKGSDG